MWGIVLGVIVALGVAFGIISTVFHRATVSVTLATYQVPVSGSFEASPTGTTLAYATKTATETGTKTVVSSGTENVSERASGVVTVFNAYAPTTQRFVTNTRFETKDGRIYKIKVPLSVPGYTTKNGAIVPGKIDATVYADAPGETYNIAGPVDFTIPGLQGSSQFTSITARSSGPIGGGFVGERAIVSPADRAQAVSDLTRELTDKATAAFAAGLGPDDLVFDGSVAVTMTSDADRPTQDGAVVTVHATASAPVFSMAALARLIAVEGGLGTALGPLRVTNLEDLSASVAPSKTAGNLTLSLSGTADLQSSYDKNALLKGLAGKSRKDVGATLSDFAGIMDMKVSLYPFWATTLPDEPGKISIMENLNAAP